MIRIYSSNGEEKLRLLIDEEYADNDVVSIPLCEGSVYHSELMTNEYVKLKFTLDRCIVFERGDYIKDAYIGQLSKSNPIGWFVITEESNATYNTTNGGYEYEVILNSWYYVWNRYILKLNPVYGAQESSFSLTDKILNINGDGTVSGHLAVISTNINHYFSKSGFSMYDGRPLRFEVMYKREDSDVNDGLVEDVVKSIVYDNNHILEAIGTIAKAYECEWWIEENVIYLGKCDKSYFGVKTTEFTIDDNVSSLKRSASKEAFATRVYGFGSTRNISARYRKSLIFTVTDKSLYEGGVDEDGDYEETAIRRCFYDSTREIDIEKFSDNLKTDFDARRDYNINFGFATLSDKGAVVIGVPPGEMLKMASLIPGWHQVVLYLESDYDQASGVSVDVKLALYKIGESPATGNPVEIHDVGVAKGIDDVSGGTGIIKKVFNTMFSTEEYYEAYFIVYASAEKIMGEGGIDFTKFSGFYTENDKYSKVVKTKINILDLDNKIVESKDILFNVFGLKDHPTKSYFFFPDDIEDIAIGTRFTVDGIVLGRVNASMFTDDTGRDSTIIGYERRLMLPIDLCPYNYVDSELIYDAEGNVDESKIVESIVVFDDVYPKKIVKIADVIHEEEEEADPTDENPNGTKIVDRYTLYVDKNDFYYESSYEISGGDGLSVIFQSGILAGIEFRVSFLGDISGTNYQAYRIEPKESGGITVPTKTLEPKPNNEIAFFGFDVALISDSNNTLVKSAEKELYNRTKEYLRKSSIDNGVYSAILMSDYAYGLDEDGEQNADYEKIFTIGDSVHLYHEGYFGNKGKLSRISGIEIKLDVPYDSPSYTIGDTQAYSRLKDIEGKIEEVKTSVFSISTENTGGGNGASIDIVTSESNYAPSEKNVYSAKASDKHFLRKDESDTAQGHITFNKGLTSREPAIFEKGWKSKDAIDSFLNGLGTLLSEDGRRLQTDNLEVRGQMKVMELIINRLTANEGDYVFTDSGTIDKVVREADGTYTATMRKRWDGDFTSFQDGDVIRGVINNIQSTGEYYTAWMRVASVNKANNTLSLIVYPDSEVPTGENHAPIDGMVVNRWGNAITPSDGSYNERQTSWYISSTEGRIVFLQGVTKPILEQSNYSAFFGLPVDLDNLKDLDLNPNMPYVYAKGIAVEQFRQIDYHGHVVRVEKDRGLWSFATATGATPYEVNEDWVDAVYHHGCKWQCLVNHTTQEPSYNATDWVCVAGNNEFTVEIQSSNGWGDFDVDSFATTLGFVAKIYNEDVTAFVLDSDVSWTRDSGNIAEDNAWAVKRAGSGKTINLTIDDLPIDHSNLRYVKFTVTAILRDGENEPQMASDEIIIN